MNILHNIVDCYINISYAEGFGLGTLEAMQCGKPIIALTIRLNVKKTKMVVYL